jgi:hypothetical protein
MQVTVTLTQEQILALTAGVSTIEIGETHAKEIVNYLLTEQGEREQLAAQRAEFEKQFADRKAATTGNFTGIPLPYNWVDEQMKTVVSLRKQVILETAELATKTMLDDLKDHVACVADQCIIEFKDKLPELLLRSYAMQFQQVMTEALYRGHQIINPEDIQQIKSRLGMS